MTGRLACALCLAAPLLAVAAPPDRTKPPAASAPRPVKMPLLQKFLLSNGLPVVLAEMREVPAVEVVLAVRAGAAADPDGRSGTACMTAEMLDEGSGGRDALAIAETFELLGAELGAECSWDASLLRLHVGSARLGAALASFADVALRPALRAKDLDRLRREALTDVLQQRDEPGQLAALALQRAVFGEGHRYGRPLRGDAAALQALKLADLRSFHTRFYHPENAALLVAGAIDAASLQPLLEKALGPWQKGAKAVPAPSEVPPTAGRQVLLVDRPGAAQSVLRVGRVGPARTTPELPALEVMNTLLGGSFTSRLNDNLREQHGYSYGASSRFDYRRVGGLFLAGADVHTPTTAEALREVMSELTRIRTPPKKEEVERSRAYLAAGYAREFETTRQIADKLAEQFAFSLPDDEFASFVPRVLDVDAKAVQRSAQTTVDPGNVAVVVVGDRAQVEKGLLGLELGEIRVWTVDELMGPAPRIEGPARPE